jgi:hypothetical protein
VREEIIRREARLSTSAHDDIEKKGKVRVTRGDGAVFYIISGGVLDGDVWVHEVLTAEEIPHQ